MGKGEWTIMAIFTAIGAVLTIVAISVESVVAKWIWGILAVAVFAFTIYATIEGIVKSRRKPKDMADLLMDYLKEEAKKPDFAQKLADGADVQAQRRDLLFKAQRPHDADYGYSCANPIMTSSVWSSDKYLANLRTFDGKQFTWERKGSHCLYHIGEVENVMVDEYQLKLNNWPDKTIFICPYGHNGSFAPKGLVLQEEVDRVCQEIKKNHPSFDIEKEKENQLFLKLLKYGFGIKTAYEILHKDELLTKRTTATGNNILGLSSEEYFEILCDNDSFLRSVKEYENDIEGEIKRRAEKNGLSFGTMSILFRHEREEEAQKAEKIKEHYLVQSQKAELLAREYANFDLREELKNEAFTQLVEAEIDLQLAYEIVHIDELFVRNPC